MNQLIVKLLKSNNPFIVACGIVTFLGGIVYGAFMFSTKANEYVSQYETKEEHAKDISQQVDIFKKDVRIAILENNKVLLDEFDRRHKH